MADIAALETATLALITAAIGDVTPTKLMQRTPSDIDPTLDRKDAADTVYFSLVAQSEEQVNLDSQSPNESVQIIITLHWNVRYGGQTEVQYRTLTLSVILARLLRLQEWRDLSGVRDLVDAPAADPSDLVGNVINTRVTARVAV
jgi:hypothetical protein